MRIWGGLLLVAAVCGAQEAEDPLDAARALLGTERHAEGVKRLDEIYAAHRKAAEEDPKNPVHCFRMGLVRFNLKKDREALVLLRKAVDLDPKNARYRHMLGFVLQYSDPEGALAAFEKAIELDSKDAQYRYALGRLLVHLEQPEKALESYRTAIKLDPKHAGALYSAGTILTDTKPDEARDLFERAVAEAPDHVSARYNLGQLHYNAKRFEKALEQWSAAVKLAPDDFDVNKKVVQAFHALGRYGDAKPYREKLFELRKKDERLKGLREFCFDQFTVGKYHVFAYETFDKVGDLYYHYTFKVMSPAGEMVRTINLESSVGIRAMGVPYLLGKNEGRVHSQLGHMWKKLPTYTELKPIVIKAAAD